MMTPEGIERKVRKLDEELHDMRTTVSANHRRHDHRLDQVEDQLIDLDEKFGDKITGIEIKLDSLLNFAHRKQSGGNNAN